MVEERNPIRPEFLKTVKPHLDITNSKIDEYLRAWNPVYQNIYFKMVAIIKHPTEFVEFCKQKVSSPNKD